MKHKHYDMIVAKAANMDLVVFAKVSNLPWVEREDQTLVEFGEAFQYFLCLPQYKEACLHWLNGGDIQWGCTEHREFEWFDKDALGINEIKDDMKYFLYDSMKIRIKPKKEKRWIAVYGAHVTDGHYPNRMLCERAVHKSDKYRNCAPESFQFIEIEVEV